MWPLSRRKTPKHFLRLFDGKSLFQLNYETLLLKFPPKEIYVQTTIHQVKVARKQAPKIPAENFFIEPEMRNHGPAMGLMAAKLAAVDPNDPFIIVQADVIREPKESFLKMIDYFGTLVLKEGKLITGGIKPQYTVMGVDYLIAKNKLESVSGINIYKMDKWLGRDTKENIEKYFKNSHVFLHANHYCWTPKLLIESYRNFPNWYEPLKKIIKAIGTPKEKEVINREYVKMEKGPVEKLFAGELENGYVAELPFNWIDFGTWESLHNYFESQNRRKQKKDDIIEIEAENCYVQKPDRKCISLIGVKDLIIVDTKDSLLICHNKKSGLVGEVVKALENIGRKDLL